MKLTIMAVALILTASTHYRTGNTGNGGSAQRRQHGGSSNNPRGRQPGSDHPRAHPSASHHGDPASGTREHSRFCGGRFRVLALDRSGQSRFLETHPRASTPTSRWSANPGASTPSWSPSSPANRIWWCASPVRPRATRGFHPADISPPLWPATRLQPIDRWRSRPDRPPWQRRPRRNSRLWRSGSRPR